MGSSEINVSDQRTWVVTYFISLSQWQWGVAPGFYECAPLAQRERYQAVSP